MGISYFIYAFFDLHLLLQESNYGVKKGLGAMNYKLREKE
jgi:hypothetical protein